MFDSGFPPHPLSMFEHEQRDRAMRTDDKMANRTFEHEWAYNALKHIARTYGKAPFMHKLRVLPRFAVAADKAKL